MVGKLPKLDGRLKNSIASCQRETEDEGCSHHNWQSRSTPGRRALFAHKVSAIEPREDGIAFGARSAFAHREIKRGQSKTSPADSIHSNAGSPFAFFRGTAIVQAHDLKNTPSSGIVVQSCGDCHLANFGAFASPERTLIFDINDFDETLPAPFEWDVKRLVSSFVLASCWRNFGKKEGHRASRAVVKAYREQMATFAGMHTLDVWYAHVAVGDLIDLYVNDTELDPRLHQAAHTPPK